MENQNDMSGQLPDFENQTWKCPCCQQQRQEKYLKISVHDVSALFGHDVGTMYVNCKYCNDMPMCRDKAMNRLWVLKYIFGDKINDDGVWKTSF
jgi:redox-regulated HSP33 family molecular chaperone